jgi:co-chaperonin GroES (HSP10)
MENKSIVIDSLTPIGERVLVSIYVKPETTDAGFILPEQEHAGMPALAQIYKTGSKTFFQKLKIIFGLKPKYKIGQWVYFRKYSVDEIRISSGGKESVLFVLEEDEIIGIKD